MLGFLSEVLVSPQNLGPLSIEVTGWQPGWAKANEPAFPFPWLRLFHGFHFHLTKEDGMKQNISPWKDAAYSEANIALFPTREKSISFAHVSVTVWIFTSHRRMLYLQNMWVFEQWLGKGALETWQSLSDLGYTEAVTGTVCSCSPHRHFSWILSIASHSLQSFIIHVLSLRSTLFNYSLCFFSFLKESILDLQSL